MQDNTQKFYFYNLKDKHIYSNESQNIYVTDTDACLKSNPLLFVERGSKWQASPEIQSQITGV